MDKADTASGGATTAPRTRDAASPSPGTSHQATSPTTSAENTGSPTASSPIGRMFCRMPRYDDSSAAEYSSGVRTTSSTTFGSNCTASTPGRNEAAMPTTTRTRGADTSRRLQIQVTASAPTTRASKSNSVCTLAGWLTYE